MYSYKSNVENPWNLFAIDEIQSKTQSLSNSSNVSCANSTQNFEKFLSNKVPVSFSGNQNVICCKICEVLVVKNRYKAHYENRHNFCNYGKDMIPFEENEIVQNNEKKIKGNKKQKRPNIKKNSSECASEMLRKKNNNNNNTNSSTTSNNNNKKIKVKSSNKRAHSKSLFNEMEYVKKKKKLNCEFINKITEEEHYLDRLADKFSISSKQNDDVFYQSKINSNKSYIPLPLNDGLCYSNESFHRTSSDSSTPPSLSLCTLQTLSSPSSLNILNDLSSVTSEHYLLSSNDLNTERSGISSKYQIDSLPWENLPCISSKIPTIVNLSSKEKQSVNGRINTIEEDCEIERAIQSITGFYETMTDEFDNNGNQISCDMSIDESKLTVVNQSDNTLPPLSNNVDSKSDMLTMDDLTAIDYFLDELTDQSNDKNHMSDVCETISAYLNPDLSQNAIDLFMSDCNNLSEYQIDSTLMNVLNSDYEEKFENLIYNTMNEFSTQSPKNILTGNSKYDDKNDSEKSPKNRKFDPSIHCGVVSQNGQFCYRSLLCKLHTMSQKREIKRSESLTSLIKRIRNCNKIKKLNKSAKTSIDSISPCSKMSCYSFLYDFSNTKKVIQENEEMEDEEGPPSLMEKDIQISEIEVPNFNFTGDNNDHENQAQPIVKSIFDKEILIGSNRPFISMKSLAWKHRSKLQCNVAWLNKFIYNQNQFVQKYASINVDEPSYQTMINVNEYSGETFNSKSLAKTAYGTVVGAPVLTSTTDVLEFDQFGNNYTTDPEYLDVKYSVCDADGSGVNNDELFFQISTLPNNNEMCQKSNLYTDISCGTNSTYDLSQFTNAKVISIPSQSNNSIKNFLSSNNGEVVQISNIANCTVSDAMIDNVLLPKSQIMSPDSFGNCTNVNVLHNHRANNIDFCSNESAQNNLISFSDQKSLSSVINKSFNQNLSVWNSTLTSTGGDLGFSSRSGSNNTNKFISLSEKGHSSTKMLYPIIKDVGQVMMVMNKNQKLINDCPSQVEMKNDNVSFAVSPSLSMKPLLTLKQNQNHYQQSSIVPTQQILSISPLEFQKLTDGLCTSNSQIINTSDIFVNPSKSDTQKSPIFYQLNQNQQANQYISSNLSSSNTDSNIIPKPLTIQSSSPNGITHKFIILPDGTISAFAQQSDNSKTIFSNQQQQQLINGTTNLQHNPSTNLFTQLSNCGQSQNCFLNGDKIIIAPNQITSSQQIIMPQIINQTELNSQPTQRFTFVQQQQPQHQQPKLLDSVTILKSNTNCNKSLSTNNMSGEILSHSSNPQKLSFQIQTSSNQCQNRVQNTYFLTTAATASSPAGNCNIPIKQPIILQSNEQIKSDYSLIDSKNVVETERINQQNLFQANSDARNINLSSSNQNIDFLSQLIHPKSIIIQQSPVNRVSNRSLSLSQFKKANDTVHNNFLSDSSQDSNKTIDDTYPKNNNNNNHNNQHIIVNKCSNEQFAQSHVILSPRQLSTSLSNNVSNYNSVVNQTQPNFKTSLPPLIISQQILNQPVSNQYENKSFIDLSFQQQSQPKISHNYYQS